MNKALKIFFISFALIIFTIGCGGSKEDPNIIYRGCGNSGTSVQLGEPIIIVQFMSLNEDTSFYKISEIVSGIKSLQSKIVFPQSAILKGIEGKVYVSVEMDSLGNIERCKLIKGIDPDCDKAVIEGIKKEIFVPAKRNGIPIKDTFAIMVLFKLQ